MRGHPWEVGFQAYNSDMFSSILGLGPGLNKFSIFSVRFGPAPSPGLRAPGGGGSRNFWRYSQSGNPLGVQHIVFNAQQEIELTETWKPFWDQLKNVEKFLKIRERRERYIHTCLLGGPLASHASSFERWSNTLYTNRWHEVVRFCQHLEKVLVVLACTFDETKYAGAPKQGEEDDERGVNAVNAFDVKQLARSFQDALFQKTVSGVILVQSLPEDLAAKLSRCPCHEAAYQRPSVRAEGPPTRGPEAEERCYQGTQDFHKGTRRVRSGCRLRLA